MHVSTRSIVVAALTLCVSQAIRAQHVTHESPEQYRASRSLTLTQQAAWCAAADTKGCDYKQISDAIALPDGGILMFDLKGPINRFDKSGKFVGALSRIGRGPGEFRYIAAPQLLKSGSLAWFDQGTMRITTLALDGTPGPVHALRLPTGVLHIGIAQGELVVLQVPPGKASGDNVQGIYTTVVDSGTARVLHTVSTPSVFAPGAMMRELPPLFSPQVVTSIGWAGDIAHANGADYSINVRTAASTTYSLQVEWSPVLVTSAEKDHAIQESLHDANVKSVAELPEMIRHSIEGARKTLPALSEMRMLRDGTLWIRPSVLSSAPRARWDVFTHDGKRAGHVMLPSKAIVVDGERDWVLVVEPGIDDVPKVVRYLVKRA